MDTEEQRASAYNMNFANGIQAIINRNYIVDYGIIKKIPGPGVVVVQMSGAKDNEDVVVTTCVLCGITSENLTINIEPKINDKVIVFYPRRYHPMMFNPAEEDPLVDKDVSSYSIFSGVAFLANQFKIKHYKNVIKVSEEGINAALSYDEKADKNNINISALADGTVEVKNPKATVTMSKEGDLTSKNTNVTLEAKDTGDISIANNAASISLNNKGDTSISNKAASISISSTGNITIDAKAGLLSIKNTAQDLGKLLDEFLGVINFLKTPGYVISPDDAAKIVAIRVKIATLFSTGFVPPEVPEVPEVTTKK